jgi:alkylated DNA repair protein (DNA oxidative demethylase)
MKTGQAVSTTAGPDERRGAARAPIAARSLPLFDDIDPGSPRRQVLAPGAVVLRGFAAQPAAALVAAIEAVAVAAPFRHMEVPGGHRMSVAMTNCGALGWVSDARGYRYSATDPLDGRAWPAMPEVLRRLAVAAAHRGGFDDFAPDACLINRYVPGARMALHQDRDERDFAQPIVSVSLGLPAMFLFGGLRRSERPVRVPLLHGDVVVWGGPARLRYHGVLALRDGHHALVGAQRINLTFRKAG